MKYNKYHDQYLEIDDQRIKFSQKVEELEATQRWYKEFDPNVTATIVGTGKRSTAKFNVELEQLKPSIARLKSEARRLKDRSSLGWNPRFWFSTERATIKANLSAKNAELGQLQNRLEWLQTQVKLHSDAVTRAEGDLKRYNTHDPLEFEAKIRALNLAIGAMSKRLQEVARQRDELDASLRVPLMELEKLTSKRNGLASDISRAQSLEDEISRAENGYERAQIHERCKQAFGDSSPRKVKGFKERELNGIDRSIKKLKTRLEEMAEKSSRMIRRLIIDGNNLCYSNSPKKFLGLSALRPLANDLAEKYNVLIVFDASIREQLRKGDQQIAECFSSHVRIHIVATGQKADETILNIAREPEDWVISGDRFTDYPEMPAVKNKRLIRHEILEGHVLVNDLGVDVCY